MNNDLNANIESQIKAQGYYVSTTVGWSMWPMLRNRRDRVIVLPLGEERLQKYDLPLYRRPDGKYVLHRIIAVKDGYYVIRGDNTYVKEKVRDEQILGVMSEFYRKGKRIDATNKKYRAYARFWNLIYPFRAVARRVRVFWWKVRVKLHIPPKHSPFEYDY